MERTLQKYEKARTVEGEPFVYDMREISKIRKHYSDQYEQTHNYKPWLKDLRDGKWDDSKVAQDVDEPESEVADEA